VRSNGHSKGRFALRSSASLVTLAGCLIAAVGVVGLGCASSPSAPVEFGKTASAKQLFEEASAILAHKRIILGWDITSYDKAINKYQDVIDNYPYSDYAVQAELRIADAFYEQKRWEEAINYYRDFAELHPDNAKVPYSIYRSALCYYEQASSANRDQTNTKKALGKLEEVSARFPNSPEAAQADVLWRKLRTRLAEHVLGIGDFYMQHQEYESAASRYRMVLNQFPGLGLDAKALYQLGLCYKKMNREADATHIFQVILENYKGSQIADAAQDLIPSAN
jgi:outer membrane protein assembly factor BamD